MHHSGYYPQTPSTELCMGKNDSCFLFQIIHLKFYLCHFSFNEFLCTVSFHSAGGSSRLWSSGWMKMKMWLWIFSTEPWGEIRKTGWDVSSVWKCYLVSVKLFVCKLANTAVTVNVTLTLNTASLFHFSPAGLFLLTSLKDAGFCF